MNNQEHLFRLTFENAAVGMAHVDRNGRFIRVNQKLAEITGYPKEELLQKTFQEITHPDDLQEDIKQLDALNLGAINSYIIRKRYFRKDGGIVWIRLTASSVTDQAGKLDFFISVIEDISKQKEAEEALQKSEQQLKMAVNAAKMGIYSRNLKSGEDFWSPELLEIYGLKPGEKIPLRDGIPAAVHPDDRNRIINEMQTRLNRSIDPEFSSDHRIVLPGGEIRWITIRGRMIFDDRDNPLQVFGVVMDITERKQIEEQIRESEARFRAIQDNSLDRFTILKPEYNGQDEIVDFSYVYQNTQAARITGRRPEELVGLRVSDIYPSFRQSRFFMMYKQAVESGEVTEFEDRYNADGVDEWFRAKVTPLPDGISVATEITTEAKHPEQALRRSEENYRLLFDKMAVVSQVLEPIFNEEKRVIDFRYIEVNLATEILTGKTKKELEGKRASELWEVVEDYWFDILEKVLKTSEPVHTESYNRQISKYYDLHAWKVNDRKVAIVLHDITARRYMEEALRESEEKFRLIANNISQLVWMGDSEGRVYWYNRRWFDFTGYSYEEIKDWQWEKLIHPGHLDRVVKGLKFSWKTGEAWEDLFPLKARNDQFNWFLFRAVPVQDEKKNIVRWFGTATNVTKQIEAEERLKRDNELIENLLYIVAHDLRGTLANIQQGLDIMKHMKPEDKLKLIDNFPTLAEQLNKTISGVTNILRVRNTDESSAMRIYFENILAEIMMEFKDISKRGSIQADFSRKKTVHYIEPFLHSIMKNLISNAIKYRRNDVPLKIEFSSMRKGEYILLKISDNGIGIDLAKYEDRLFSPFQRLNSGKTKGTGIGLYLVKNIVEKNGGFIKVESIIGIGTTFNCYLKEY